LFHGVHAIHGLATYLPFRGWLKESPESPPEYLMIIYY
jgi:hypothetical protein